MTATRDAWTRERLRSYEEEIREVGKCAKDAARLAKKVSRGSSSLAELDRIHHEIRAALDRAAWAAEEEL